MENKPAIKKNKNEIIRIQYYDLYDRDNNFMIKIRSTLSVSAMEELWNNFVKWYSPDLDPYQEELPEEKKRTLNIGIFLCDFLHKHDRDAEVIDNDNTFDIIPELK